MHICNRCVRINVYVDKKYETKGKDGRGVPVEMERREKGNEGRMESR